MSKREVETWTERTSAERERTEFTEYPKAPIPVGKGRPTVTEFISNRGWETGR